MTVARRSLRRGALAVVLLLACLPAGCVNPFAPEEGEIAGDLWDPQTTIGGMLRNFQTSYMLRDSLRYADIIAEEFVFQYFDVDRERYDEWYRETELRTTGKMMRVLNTLDLRWGPIPEAIDTFAVTDSLVEFSVNFSLSLEGFEPVFGFARFRTIASSELDGRFRLVLWRDDY
jgi:hypothetical protein